MGTLTPEDWDAIAEEYGHTLTFIGTPADREWLDKAIIGIGNQHGKPGLVVYSYNKLVQAFTDMYVAGDDYGTVEEAYAAAQEWVDFKVVCAWLGEYTPIIVQDYYDEI